jgi:[citrate (pro-3S)-lyase] ligase
MMAYLPPLGIRVDEIQRKEFNGIPISASRVRALIDQGEIERTKELVPPTTYDYIRAHFLKER